MLRVAVPNKGALSERASATLTDAGYRQRSARHELTMVDTVNDVEFFFLRPRDIATYVGSGDLDLGITGRDLLLDSATAAVVELLELDFGTSRFRFAASPGTADSAADLDGKRVATAYPGLVAEYLEDRGIKATVIRLDGAVETSVRLGVADVIADVVETGATLRQRGLEVFGETILESRAVLIGRQTPRDVARAQAEQMFERLRGVLVARQYVMMAYDVHVSRLEKACTVTPGIEAPTVSPLHSEGWVAVQAMVPTADIHRAMDELHGLGARGILATAIKACRL